MTPPHKKSLASPLKVILYEGRIRRKKLEKNILNCMQNFQMSKKHPTLIYDFFNKKNYNILVIDSNYPV